MNPLIETYLGIYEDFIPLTREKEKRVMSKIDNLVGDISRSAETVKKLRKKPLAKFRPSVKRKIASEIKDAKKAQGLVQKASDAVIRSSVDREAKAIKQMGGIQSPLDARSNIRRFHREEVDYIVDVLVSEGFVNDYKSAISILEAMSNEWLESILDEAFNDKGEFIRDTPSSDTTSRPRTTNRGRVPAMTYAERQARQNQLSPEEKEAEAKRRRELARTLLNQRNENV